MRPLDGTLITGRFYKSKYRRNTVLLTKNDSIHIKHMPRRHFSFAPCLAWKIEFLEAPYT
jgi:hypothetical protein